MNQWAMRHPEEYERGERYEDRAIEAHDLTDADADAYHERQEERRQREADREDFRKHE